MCQIKIKKWFKRCILELGKVEKQMEKKQVVVDNEMLNMFHEMFKRDEGFRIAYNIAFGIVMMFMRDAYEDGEPCTREELHEEALRNSSPLITEKNFLTGNIDQALWSAENKFHFIRRDKNGDFSITEAGLKHMEDYDQKIQERINRG